MAFGEILLEEKTVDVDSVPVAKGEDEVEIGETPYLFGELDAFREAKDGQLRQVDFFGFHWVLFSQNGFEGLLCLASD